MIPALLWSVTFYTVLFLAYTGLVAQSLLLLALLAAGTFVVAAYHE